MTTLVDKNRTGLLPSEDHTIPAEEGGQYALWQIMGIWLAGGAPLWILSWLVYPALSLNRTAMEAGMLRIQLLLIGLVWQFLLAMIILYREEGNLRWGTIRRRFWLNNPVSPITGQENKRLWWLVIPFILLVAGFELAVSPSLNRLWTEALPFFAEPPGAEMGALFTPELQEQWVGAWGSLVLFVALAVFNTFLGEEFLFRGVLLPKMKGVFGRWDWVANGVMFGLYHLHKPWGIANSVLTGLVYAGTGRQFRSNWFPIILHSGQSVFFILLILGLVLGLA